MESRNLSPRGMESRNLSPIDASPKDESSRSSSRSTTPFADSDNEETRTPTVPLKVFQELQDKFNEVQRDNAELRQELRDVKQKMEEAKEEATERHNVDVDAHGVAQSHGTGESGGPRNHDSHRGREIGHGGPRSHTKTRGFGGDRPTKNR